jgi:hypothetical protein
MGFTILLEHPTETGRTRCSAAASCSAPPTDITSASPPTWRCASTPGATNRAFGSSAATREVMFRPRGFPPHRRFAPHGVSGVLQPVPVVRFAAFRPFEQALRTSPRRGSTPRRIPLAGSTAPHHCGRCPPAVTANPTHGPQPEAEPRSPFLSRDPSTDRRGLPPAHSLPGYQSPTTAISRRGACQLGSNPASQGRSMPLTFPNAKPPASATRLPRTPMARPEELPTGLHSFRSTSELATLLRVGRQIASSLRQ